MLKNLSKREKHMLKSYAANYEKERNLDSTRTPVVLVQTKELIPTTHDFSEDNVFILYIEGEFSGHFESEEEAFVEINDFLESNYDVILSEEESTENELTSYGIQLVDTPVIIHWETRAMFLSRHMAKEYVEGQKHNLGEIGKNVRIFSQSLGYSNYTDLDTFIPLLRQMGEQLIEEEGFDV